MFENPKRGRQARNFTTNVPKILDLKSSSEQIFSENGRWVPLPKFPSLFQAFRSWGQRKEMWVEKKTTTTRGWGVGKSPPPSSLPLPLFLLNFFSLSSFASHSTIRTPGTAYKFPDLLLKNWPAVTVCGPHYSEVPRTYFLLYCVLLNGNFDKVYQNADWVIFPASYFYLRFFCVE